MLLSQQRVQPPVVLCQGDQGLDGRPLLRQRRGVDDPPRVRYALAGAARRGGFRLRPRAGNTGFRHQLRATATASVATTAALVAATACSVAATAAPVTAGASTDIQLYPFEDGSVLRHTGCSALSGARGATTAAAGEPRSRPSPKRRTPVDDGQDGDVVDFRYVRVR